jgi:dihydrofolate reductase/thymidylate synthase
MIPDLTIILAVDSQGGIGLNQTIPWKIKEDMQWFKDVTTGKKYGLPNRHDKTQTDGINVIIMGRLTADTMTQILPNRISIVVTKQTDYRKDEGFISVPNLMSAINWIKQCDEKIANSFVIGGVRLVEEAIDNPYCRTVFICRIAHNYDCDRIIGKTFFDKLTKNYQLNDTSVTSPLCFEISERVQLKYEKYHYMNWEECKYLDMMREIIEYGRRAQTRNGITYSLFGKTMEFDLDNGFPLLTTRKMAYRAIIKELLFFLKGHTNTKELEDSGVNIWKQNTSADFLQKNGFALEEYDMGPMYGFQWRHFGTRYHGMNHDYTGQGVDQLAEVVELLVKDPNSRRILMTTYNPAQAKEGCLYPCHGLTVQFYVESDNRISLHMYQRSMDFFLGASFNIPSYALLIHIICSMVNNRSQHTTIYRPGRLIISVGDVHVYADEKADHMQAVKQQLERRNSTHRFPKLRLKRQIILMGNTDNETTISLDLSKHTDFELIDYLHESPITADMLA